jgi:hypothetical protein
MQLQAALRQIAQSPDFPGFFVITLQGYDYPAAFLGGFFRRLKILSGDLMFLDCEQSSLNMCKAHLEMTFLGMRTYYVLSHFTSLDAAAKKDWKSYLESYEGPHTIFLFESLGAAPRGRKAVPKKVAPSHSSHRLHIELPQTIDRDLYKELFAFLYPSIVPDSSFMLNDTLDLDDAYRLMSYQVVVGRNSKEFFGSWYPKLVVSEASLFTLSQYLLARNVRLFLPQWRACKDAYPQEFWIAYWSEQVWQAAQFVAAARTSGAEEAKKGFYRLPFTFLNTDWKRYTPQVLAEAHNELYELDYASKNGGGDYALELWYHRFLRTI